MDGGQSGVLVNKQEILGNKKYMGKGKHLFLYNRIKWIIIYFYYIIYVGFWLLFIFDINNIFID